MSKTAVEGESGRTTGVIAARAATLAVVLAVAWLLWSGLYKPLLLALGGCLESSSTPR